MSTKSVYLTSEEVQKARASARKVIELAAGQAKLVIVDFERVRKVPKVDKDNRPYVSFVCEVEEISGEEHIDRELELTEFRFGKLAEVLSDESGTPRTGIVKMTGKVDARGYVQKEFSKI